MVAYKCDRCGRDMKDEERIKPLLLVEDGEKAVDLCPVCYDQLFRWYKRTKRNKPRPIEIPEIVDGFIFK